MRNKIIYLCFISFLFLGNVFCDTIALKSGKQIQGSIKARTNDAVKVDIEGITLTYYLTDIESINGEKVVLPVSSQPVLSVEDKQSVTPVVSDSNILSVSENLTAAQNIADEATTEEAAVSTNQQNKDISGPGNETSNNISEFGKQTSRFPRGKISEKDAKVAVAVVGGIALFIFFLSLIFYVYSALCLYLIAKKTAVEPAWLAWIPIANLFLMCNIAKISYLWLLGILGLFIPFVSILANIYLIGLFVYVWYKIAIARNKPGWVGILTILPIANLVIMGYLAFSE
ncbi:MAG: hypothetical protein M0R48_04895 [Candidatus Omnitrophica bacterium]|jgi:hypothetical protein|nr:hypothetical protein [Candidatus Omnitrophota bacterium]